MKNHFKVLALLSALLAPLSAQEGDGYGFLNIANLIPADDPCEIMIGGETLVPDGLKPGEYTGWFMVKKGSKNITISLGEMDAAAGNITLVEGQGNLIAIYLEPDDRVKPDGRPFPPKIRIRSFPTYESKGFGLKFVSFYPGENRFQLGPLKLDPEPFKPLEIPKWNGGGFEISRNGSSVSKVGGSSEGGAFYLLVGTDLKDGHTAVLVSSNHQEVPEYLKEKKPGTRPNATSEQTANPQP